MYANNKLWICAISFFGGNKNFSFDIGQLSLDTTGMKRASDKTHPLSIIANETIYVVMARTERIVTF